VNASHSYVNCPSPTKSAYLSLHLSSHPSTDLSTYLEVRASHVQIHAQPTVGRPTCDRLKKATLISHTTPQRPLACENGCNIRRELDPMSFAFRASRTRHAKDSPYQPGRNIMSRNCGPPKGDQFRTAS